MMEFSSECFDADKIARSGQCFRMAACGDGAWSLIAGNRLLRIEEVVGGKAAGEAPDHGESQPGFRLDCSEDEFSDIWEDYFDLREDYGVFERAIDPTDDYLREAAEFSRGIRILRQDLWEMMVSFLISQNNNIPRITRSIETLCEAYGPEHESAGVVFHGFPAPETLTDEVALEGFGLGYRLPYIVGLARSVTDGGIDLSALESDEDHERVHQQLLGITGVGPKVAACIELFGLHWLDAYPVDTWVDKAMATHYKSAFDWTRYAGFQGVVQQYLFFYTRETGNGERR